MSPLVHLIYSSAATKPLPRAELVDLLDRARAKNSSLGITGMLLYVEGSFLQVLEGEPHAVEELFDVISGDPRHGGVVTIIHEPIAKRDFGEWSMGLADISADDLDSIVGLNDFFEMESCFTDLDSGRTKKLLKAFRAGRWRSQIAGQQAAEVASVAAKATSASSPSEAPVVQDEDERPEISFAFQPLVDLSNRTITGYQAIVRSKEGEDPREVLSRYATEEGRVRMQIQSIEMAIGMAGRLGLTGGLTLSYPVPKIEEIPRIIDSALQMASRSSVSPSQLTFEVEQHDIGSNPSWFSALIQERRGAGLRFSINGSGGSRFGLGLIDSFQPDSIALSKNLVRGIESHGARQAMVRGMIQTCDDLGIDVIVKHLETSAELQWFHSEGVELFQGDLIAGPAFEQLSTEMMLPSDVLQ